MRWRETVEKMLSVMQVTLRTTLKMKLIVTMLGHICTRGVCTGRFGLEGGLWDAEDSCCENRCTTDHPCADGLVR